MEILNQTQVPKIKTEFPICHSNLNSLSAHNVAKLTQLKACNSIYNFDFICFSETYLDSATPKNLLEIVSYNLVQADHLNNVKRGGGCIYYKESLLVYAINLPYFKETLLLKMSHNNRLYRLPSQNNDELDFTFKLSLSNCSCKF